MKDTLFERFDLTCYRFDVIYHNAVISSKHRDSYRYIPELSGFDDNQFYLEF